MKSSQRPLPKSNGGLAYDFLHRSSLDRRKGNSAQRAMETGHFRKHNRGRAWLPLQWFSNRQSAATRPSEAQGRLAREICTDANGRTKSEGNAAIGIQSNC